SCAFRQRGIPRRIYRRSERSRVSTAAGKGGKAGILAASFGAPDPFSSKHNSAISSKLSHSRLRSWVCANRSILAARHWRACLVRLSSVSATDAVSESDEGIAMTASAQRTAWKNRGAVACGTRLVGSYHAFKSLERAVLLGDFDENGRSRVLYL